MISPFIRIAAAVVACGLIGGCRASPALRSTQLMMGTFVEVVARDESAPRIVFKEIKRIERLLSVYDPESEIARLNEQGTMRVSEETLYVLKRAMDFWWLTEGTFDVTVGPLMELWGFRDKTYRKPSPEEIAATLAKVGCNKLLINEQARTVTFTVKGMKVDLGGIAKGYALDEAVKRLKEHGITDCLINAGGQVYALGKNGNRPWRVGIWQQEKGQAAGSVPLTNMSCSTSGDYAQSFVMEGKRFSHLIDPRTGSPADTDLSSVTVIAADALTADCLSTAMFILGRDNASKLKKRFPEISVIVQPHSGGE